ncbi:MAG TPA: PAS domain S-box protein [Chloroflexota bacterium]|nr:PAS domain S-box protein [Chloroflexota bacterium]
MAPPQAALPSVASYEALYRRPADLHALLDADGLVRYASPSIQPLLGLVSTALLGTALLERIHQDDRAAVRDALAAVLARPEAEAAVTYRCQHADGSWLAIAATLANGLDDPLLGGLVVAGRDMTALRAAEAGAAAATARLQAVVDVTDTVLAHVGLDDLLRRALELEAIFEAIGDAVIVYDAEGQVLRANAAAHALNRRLDQPG